MLFSLWMFPGAATPLSVSKTRTVKCILIRMVLPMINSSVNQNLLVEPLSLSPCADDEIQNEVDCGPTLWSES
jgi:hypothetical protein